MVKRILGGILFVWMAAAVYGSTKDKLSKGPLQPDDIAIIVGFSALAVIGLLLALGRTQLFEKRKPPSENP